MNKNEKPLNPDNLGSEDEQFVNKLMEKLRFLQEKADITLLGSIIALGKDGKAYHLAIFPQNYPSDLIVQSMLQVAHDATGVACNFARQVGMEEAISQMKTVTQKKGN